MRHVLPVLLATAIAGCGPKAPGSDTMPAGAAPAATSAAGDALTGPVLEQLAASPYLYLRLKTSRGDVWAAIPEAKLETGTVVTVVSPMLMTRFESTSLQRTFDEIYFGTLATEGTATSGLGDDPHAGVPRSAATIAVGKVEKATGADAHTVSEIWARKASLDGGSVSLRGVVVKVNDGIMGKNWIHLQDGSGDAIQGTNDITVTSLDQAVKGTTVTVRGTVRTNRDFGAGYVYPVLVEDGKIVK